MLGSNWKIVCICTALWTAAFALAAGGTVRQNMTLMFWSLLAGQIACIVTGWLVAVCAACAAAREERIEIEHLATIMAGVAAAERGVPHLPRS